MKLERVVPSRRHTVGTTYEYILTEVYSQEEQEDLEIVEGVYWSGDPLTSIELTSLIKVHNAAHEGRTVTPWDILKGIAPTHCLGYVYVGCYIEVHVIEVRKERVYS